MVDFDDMKNKAEDEQWDKKAEDAYKSKFEHRDDPRQDQMGQQDDTQGQGTQPNQQ
jgi:hypothetical protein